MALSDRSEKLILGVNPRVFAYTLAILMTVAAVVMDHRQRLAEASIPR